ncbi:MAG TPA: YciI family protein [Longimicrobiaceae bacterium]|nr:YciI family protein [Longimicrobiaceae bacterium]
MKFLVLAYGAEEDWNGLSKAEQDALLAQDEVLRRRGALVAAVEQAPVTVRAWDGTPDVTRGPFAETRVPLAGFGVIEAADLDEAIALVKDTPCARAGGAVELRPITAINDVVVSSER